MGTRSISAYPDDMEDYEVREQGRPTIGELIALPAKEERGVDEERVIDAGRRNVLRPSWCGYQPSHCRRDRCEMWVGDGESGDCCHKLSAMALHYIATEKCAGR